MGSEGVGVNCEIGLAVPDRSGMVIISGGLLCNSSGVGLRVVFKVDTERLGTVLSGEA